MKLPWILSVLFLILFVAQDFYMYIPILGISLFCIVILPIRIVSMALINPMISALVFGFIIGWLIGICKNTIGVLKRALK